MSNTATSAPQINPYKLARRAGGYYYPLTSGLWSNTNGALTLNQLVAIKVPIGALQSFTSIIMAGSGTASSFGRCGLYYDNNGLPDGLVPNSDSGSISMAAAGVLDFPFASTITIGDYIWVSYVPQSVSCSVNKFNAIQGSNIYVFTSSPYSVGASMGYGRTGVTGALPSSWGSTYLDLGPTNFPIMYLKTA